MILQKLQEKITGLDKMKIASAVVYKDERVLQLKFVLPVKPDVQTQQQISEFCNCAFQPSFTVECTFAKDFMDCDYAKQHAKAFMEEHHFSILQKVDSIEAFDKEDGGIEVVLTVGHTILPVVEEIDLAKKISHMFNDMTNFDVDVKIDVVQSKTNLEEVLKSSELAQEVQMTKIKFQPIRKIVVSDVELIFGKKITKMPQYIVDIIDEVKGVYLCGRVEAYSEQITKTGKKLVKFEISDFTGKISVVCFESDENSLKLKEIKDAGTVVVFGNVVENNYSNELELRGYSVAKCTIVDEQCRSKESKPAPTYYVTVVPEVFGQSKQQEFFESNGKMCKQLIETEYVVFDFETTGLSEIKEKAIELGAVKLRGGVVVEKFSTFLKPEIYKDGVRETLPIPTNITALTGITDEMVQDAPTFQEVVGDFFKFCEGCTLVAHNMKFDYGFLSFNAKNSGYVFSHPQIDTINITRQYVEVVAPEDKPSNFKLGTVAEYFGFSNPSAHRAEHDAVATAQIFVTAMNLIYNR